MSFANLKRNKNKIDQLVAAAEATGGGNSNNKYEDTRFWKPTVDKANNGYAVIRFLPAAEGNDLPWNRYWDHGFKGPTGRWYIEKSLTSIGQNDPVGELNSRLWNSGVESDKQKARNQKRRLHYVSNVMVVNDPANPDNEGKVFLYQYGKKIFDNLTDAMQPEFADEEPVNPFDFWNGANFKLKIRDVEGYRNYDKSEFSASSALNDSDAELEKIYNGLYDLREFADAAQYKSYDELKAKLMSVLGEEANAGALKIDDEIKLGNETPAPTMKETAPSTIEETISSNDDEDDLMAHFSQLLDDDEAA